jgi:hypothetical protein
LSYCRGVIEGKILGHLVLNLISFPNLIHLPDSIALVKGVQNYLLEKNTQKLSHNSSEIVRKTFILFIHFELLVKAPLKHHPYLDSLYSSIVFWYIPIAKPFLSFISLYSSNLMGFYVQSRNGAFISSFSSFVKRFWIYSETVSLLLIRKFIFLY